MSALAHPVAKPAGLAQFGSFLAVSSLAALSNFGAVWAFEHVAPYPVAVVLGYLVGMGVGFALLQRVTFGDPGTPLRQRAFRFTVVNLIGLALAWTVSMALAYWALPAAGWTFEVNRVANLLGLAAPALSSYLLHKRYTYR